MTVASDFDSYAFGVRLTSANYSGGAGGTFDDLVNPARKWTVDSATPTFVTVLGREGMDFVNDISYSVRTSTYFHREFTWVAVARTDAISDPVFGSSGDGANGQHMSSNNSNNAASATCTNGSAVATITSTVSSLAIWAMAANPITGYVNMWVLDSSGTIKKATPTLAATSAFRQNSMGDTTYGVGEHRTSYLDGVVCDVYGFSRDLITRDPTNLEAFMETLGAEIGY